MLLAAKPLEALCDYSGLELQSLILDFEARKEPGGEPFGPLLRSALGAELKRLSLSEGGAAEALWRELYSEDAPIGARPMALAFRGRTGSVLRFEFSLFGADARWFVEPLLKALGLVRLGTCPCELVAVHEVTPDGLRALRADRHGLHERLPVRQLRSWMGGPPRTLTKVRYPQGLFLLEKRKLIRRPLETQDLLRAGLRRLRELETRFGAGSSDRQEGRKRADALFARAESWTGVSREGLWVRSDRYSARQNARHPMDRIVGEMSLRDPEGEAYEIFRLFERTGLGGKTAFGLGAIELDWRPL